MKGALHLSLNSPRQMTITGFLKHLTRGSQKRFWSATAGTFAHARKSARNVLIGRRKRARLQPSPAFFTRCRGRVDLVAAVQEAQRREQQATPPSSPISTFSSTIEISMSPADFLTHRL